MVVCEACGREMLTADGCSCTHLEIEGRMRGRIRVGAPGDLFYDMYVDVALKDREKMRCPDCNALAWHYHHPGCDAEACPVCGLQLLSCGCEKGDAGLVDERE